MEGVMANRSLFAPMSWPGYKNEAGGVAYRGTPKQGLAQLAATSCLNNTLYVSAEKQLDNVLSFANKVEPEFIAKCAVYAREKHNMRDMPALLCAVLASHRQTKLLKQVFPRVIDSGDMLRNFFQMIRSGMVGRRSFGTVPKQLIINWFNCHTPTELFEQSVGTPSMRDILRCVRPRPLDRTRSAIYAWFVGKTYDHSLLPEKVQCFENWKASPDTTDLPAIPFQMLTSQTLTTEHWTTIARRAGWLWLLKNLNNMKKHGVYESHPEMVDFVAARLSDRKSIQKSRAFPYRILTAYQNAKDQPDVIRKALHEAMEVATENVPVLPEAKGGNPPAYLLVDVSKSMTFPVTGDRYGYGNRANSSMQRVDVAALIACSILRKNKNAEILLFNTNVITENGVPMVVDPKDTVLSNATRISKIAKGGTACSAPLKMLNEQGKHGDLIVYVSDDQSWAESMNIDRFGRRQAGKTALQSEWETWKMRNPQAKMVCIDIAPYTTTQAQERPDTMNIGGFSDTVFELVGSFADGSMNADHLVGIIESIDLDGAPLNEVKADDAD